MCEHHKKNNTARVDTGLGWNPSGPQPGMFLGPNTTWWKGQTSNFQTEHLTLPMESFSKEMAFQKRIDVNQIGH